MIFEDDETLRMYVDESLEHLSNIENDLLTIEEGGDDLDEELVNNVFRAAHSIKGGAGFMGLSVVKDLSHNLENVLGMIRTHEMVPTPEIISVLLKAFDKLTELIQNIATSNDADVSDEVAALVAITTGSLPESEKESVSTFVEISIEEVPTKFIVPQFDVDQAFKQGKFIYIVEYDMIKDIQKKNKTPMDVIKSLLNSGIIIDSKVDLMSVGTLESDMPPKIPFCVLFASIIEPDMAATLVDLAPEFIHNIEEKSINKMPADYDPSAEVEKIEVVKPVVKEAVPEAKTEPVVAEPTAENIEKVSAPEVVQEKPPAVEVKQEVVAHEVEHVIETHPEEHQHENEVHLATPSQKAPQVKAVGQTSLRVNINLLDTLMTLAGELVLSRNQLIQGITGNIERAIEASGQRIDMITSELQEAIMRTRMQPISNVFNKFTRVVRDLSKDLGKQIDLTLEGKEVELDKTIIEAINDPLTHLVRNSVDHGIESPDVRLKKGKTPVGKITLKAYHEAGQVNIEIADDGKGLDGEQLALSAIKKGLVSEQDINTMSANDKINLIFLPGFSTAAAITDVSGRGVGMDVVKTNLDKLGGIIDIDSQINKGTTINIKLPLTLAIIPSQIIVVSNERYAIPQVNLDELLRIPAAQVKERIEKVGDADVVRLRGTLLPLLNLAEVMHIQKTFIHPVDGLEYPDKRVTISDRRSKQLLEDGTEVEIDEASIKKRSGEDRRFHAASAINIAVVSAGSFKYGLVVDELRDSEEIVVKPLGRHLSQCEGYAGATIMGDGKVALILDVASLARMGELTAIASSDINSRDDVAVRTDRSSMLLFRNAENEQFAAPLNLVERIERIKHTDIEEVGGKRVIQYRGGTLPLHELSEVADVKPLPERDQHEVIVFKVSNKEVGLLVTPPVDALEVSLNVDATTLKQTGIMGSIIVADHTTLLVDMFEIVKTLNPDWFIEKESSSNYIESEALGQINILFAEDSAFFRNQVKSFFEEEGFKVLTAEDGAIAWELLQKEYKNITIVVTDLEMPVMDGFELTKKIKNHELFGHLPVIALTSLASDKDIAKGKEVGMDSYEIKLDRERLIDVVKEHAKKNLK